MFTFAQMQVLAAISIYGHIDQFIKFIVVVKGMGKWVWSQVVKVASDYSQSLKL